MRLLAILAVLFTTQLSAQIAPKSDDPWTALRFLEGTWDAKTQGQSSGANATGTYTFKKELGGHVLARHSSSAACKGPPGFDCEHGDLLYIYQDAPGQPLKAIYFDNEGHVIHYSVSTPTPASAIFMSDPSAPGPHFRLMYELKGALMSGKFQMQMPGKTDWASYLEWSGAKK
jgi:hypothetical protein